MIFQSSGEESLIVEEADFKFDKRWGYLGLNDELHQEIRNED